MYWRIGRAILDRQDAEGWGAKVIERLGADLRFEFPDLSGLSTRNLRYMRSFGEAWPTEIVQQPVAQLAWGHITVLLDRLKSSELRARLAAEDSELTAQMVKDPYNFEFLGLAGRVAERDLEQALMDRLQRFLLELGHGFSLYGRQYRFELDGQDFVVDLVFFNVVFDRFVIIELKVGRFEPAQLGQLQFYVEWAERHLRRPRHHPTVGILLVEDRSDVVVRYALAATKAPLAVATYTYDTLPAETRRELPTETVLSDAVQSAFDSIRPDAGAS